LLIVGWGPDFQIWIDFMSRFLNIGGGRGRGRGRGREDSTASLGCKIGRRTDEVPSMTEGSISRLHRDNFDLQITK